MKSVLATAGARAELAALIEAYDLARIDERFPRTRRRACPEGGLNCADPDCFCERGVVTDRILWVNATAAYAARLSDTEDGLAATLLVMDFGEWLSVNLYYGEIMLSEELRVSSTGGSLYATTSAYDGGRVGSAVYNPGNLRGPLYRCSVPTPAGGYRDGFARPEDIVAYLAALPAEERSGGPATGEKIELGE